MTYVNEAVWLHIANSIFDKQIACINLKECEVLFCVTNLVLQLTRRSFLFFYISPGNSVTTTAACLQECTWTWEPSHTLANHAVLHAFLILCLIALCLSTKDEKKLLVWCTTFIAMIRIIQLLPGNAEISGGSSPPSVFVLSEVKYFLVEGGE